MGSVYLNGSDPRFPSLLTVVRSAGLEAVPTTGWETRARASTRGFPSVGPAGVVVHHTASPPRASADAQFVADYNYCAFGHRDAPVGNLVLGPHGKVAIIAAGAANTQGKGGPWLTSRGPIAKDNGNATLLAIEACNDGMGQPWPEVMQDAYVRLVAALCKAYGFRPERWGQHASDVLSHFEWCQPSCPGRKCDPAGPSRWAPKPAGGCQAANLWNMDAFRASVAAAMLPGETPTAPPKAPLPEEDDPMDFVQAPKGTPNAPDAQAAFPFKGRADALWCVMADGNLRHVTGQEVALRSGTFAVRPVPLEALDAYPYKVPADFYATKPAAPGSPAGVTLPEGRIVWG